VFLQKSPQALENKRQQLKKERQESSRARKLLMRRRLEFEMCERPASDGGNAAADSAQVRQGKELTGLASISWDIIPFG
jgi:hypothetical protein